MKIKISADSVCDLTDELIEKHNIGIMHGYIVRGEVSYRDGIDITPEDIFNAVEAGAGVCTTSANNVADYTEMFSGYMEEYDAVIHFFISSQMSASYRNACLAAEELGGNIYLIDSKNLSTGVGMLVLKAAEMAAAGEDALKIKETVEELRDKVEASFVIAKLDYLRKGGRCSAMAAFGANLLNLKPCVEVKDGAMGVGKKYRGSFENCLEEYVRERLEGRDDIDYSRAFITHTRMDPALVEKIRQSVLLYAPFEEIFETDARDRKSTRLNSSH